MNCHEIRGCFLLLLPQQKHPVNITEANELIKKNQHLKSNTYTAKEFPPFTVDDLELYNLGKGNYEVRVVSIHNLDGNMYSYPLEYFLKTFV